MVVWTILVQYTFRQYRGHSLAKGLTWNRAFLFTDTIRTAWIILPYFILEGSRGDTHKVFQGLRWPDSRESIRRFAWIAWFSRIVSGFRNRSDFCNLRLGCPSQTPEIARFPRQEKAVLHCDLRARWKVASDLRLRAAISEPKTSSFCRISGDLSPSTRKSLAIAILRFWCAKSRIVSGFPNCMIPFFANRASGATIANHRFEVIRANRMHVMKIGVFLRIDSCESIRASRTDSRCESPGHLSSGCFQVLSGNFRVFSGCFSPSPLRGSPLTLPIIFQELTIVIITPPITPNEFWGIY